MRGFQAIAVHTFCIIFFQKGLGAIRLASVVVCIIWLYVIIFVVASIVTHHKQGDDIYTPTPWVGNLVVMSVNLYPCSIATVRWNFSGLSMTYRKLSSTGCWIASRFKGERIAGEYFWLWSTAFVSMALYIPLFFRVRGNIRVDEKRWRVRFCRRSRINAECTQQQSLFPESPMDNGESHVSGKFAREALNMLL